MEFQPDNSQRYEKTETEFVEALLSDAENKRKFVGFWEIAYQVADREGLLEDD